MGSGPRVGRGALSRAEQTALIKAVDAAEDALGSAATAPAIERRVRGDKPELYDAWCDATPAPAARQKFIRTHRDRKPSVRDAVPGIPQLDGFPPVRFGDRIPVEMQYADGLTFPDPRKSWHSKRWGPAVRWGLTFGTATSLVLTLLIAPPDWAPTASLWFVLFLAELLVLGPLLNSIWTGWWSWRQAIRAEIIATRYVRPADPGASYEMQLYRRDGLVVAGEYAVPQVWGEVTRPRG